VYDCAVSDVTNFVERHRSSIGYLLLKFFGAFVAGEFLHCIRIGGGRWLVLVYRFCLFSASLLRRIIIFGCILAGFLGSMSLFFGGLVSFERFGVRG